MLTVDPRDGRGGREEGAPDALAPGAPRRRARSRRGRARAHARDARRPARRRSRRRRRRRARRDRPRHRARRLQARRCPRPPSRAKRSGSRRSTRSSRSTGTAPSSSSRARGSTWPALESTLEQMGDSLLVVGDESALKVHVHTDDPGAALTLATPWASSRGSRSRTCTSRPRRARSGSSESPPARERLAPHARDRPRRGLPRPRQPPALREPRRDARHRGRADDEPVDRGHRRRDRVGSGRRRSSCSRTTATSSSPRSRRRSSHPSRCASFLHDRCRRDSPRWFRSSRRTLRRRTRWRCSRCSTRP